MSRRSLVALLAASLLVVGAFVLVTLPSPGATGAQPHGGLVWPAARTYACFLDSRVSDGKPSNRACADAVLVGGTEPLENWSGVARGDGAGRDRGFVADRQLCSAGNAAYAAYDAPRDDWPVTTLQQGATVDFALEGDVDRPGTLRVFITKDAVDLQESLQWADFEEAPLVTVEPTPADQDAYKAPVRLPKTKSGRHVLYSVWHAGDGATTYYSCSDVFFDAVSAAPSPPAKASNAAGGPCRALVTARDTMPDGFSASVTVTNTGSKPMNDWYASFTLPKGVRITSAWNGTHMQNGPSAMIHAPAARHTLAPGETVTAGFLAKGPADPAFTDVRCG